MKSLKMLLLGMLCLLVLTKQMKGALAQTSAELLPAPPAGKVFLGGPDPSEFEADRLRNQALAPSIAALQEAYKLLDAGKEGEAKGWVLKAIALSPLYQPGVDPTWPKIGHPMNDAAVELLSLLELWEGEDPAKVIEQLRPYLWRPHLIDPNNPDSVALDLCIAYCRLGQYALARQFFNVAWVRFCFGLGDVAVPPDDIRMNAPDIGSPQGLEAICWMLESSPGGGSYARYKNLQQAVRLMPGNPLVCYAMGSYLALSGGNVMPIAEANRAARRYLKEALAYGSGLVLSGADQALQEVHREAPSVSVHSSWP